MISFGPEHAPLEQKQVELAIEEAQTLVPKPKIIVFAAFQFDPEAAKDIDETDWPGVTLLKVQMNADLLTEDLKKKRASNESFWLIGQPDIDAQKDQRRQRQGEISRRSSWASTITTPKREPLNPAAMKRSPCGCSTPTTTAGVCCRDRFSFLIAGENDGWSRLARNLKAEIDEELIEAYRGTVSLPFRAGQAQARRSEDRR